VKLFDVEMTSPSALGKSTGLSRGAVSKLIDRLEKRLLTRAEAAGDRRFQDIRLTAVGRKLVPHLAALADKNDEEFFHHLSHEERKHLVTTLRKLVEANKLSKIPTE
jgi:DNA-binding MarR family transcriptional regulator